MFQLWLNIWLNNSWYWLKIEFESHFLAIWVFGLEKNKDCQYISGFKEQQIQTFLFPIFNILGRIE